MSMLCVSMVSLSSGCASMTKRIDLARTAYYQGDLETARREWSEIAESRSPHAKPAKLNLAMVDIARGDLRSAQTSLREARDVFDEAAKIEVVGDVASMLTDDRTRAYHPAGYEEVMVRSMLSLCSLASGDGDAEAYAMQAQMRQSELARIAEERGLQAVKPIYQPLALAPYMRGVLREATHHDFDDAIRCYQMVSHLQPSFAPASVDIQRCGGGVIAPPGHGVLYVFACVGRGPVLESVPESTTTAAMQIASQVYSLAENQRALLPNLAAVEVPRVRIPGSPAAAISIDSSGVWLGATQPLVNVGEMAINQNEAEMPWTIARAVARRVTKEVTVNQAVKAVGINGLPGELARFATVTAWSATEQADTRCWSLMAREIQVLRAELPAGTHRIGFTVVGPGGNLVGPKATQRVEIPPASNAYMVIIAPDRHVIVAQ